MIELAVPAGWQADMIDRAVQTAAGDDRIRAAWLGGSFGSGEQDAVSDIDLHYLVAESSAEWFTRHWRQVAAHVAGATLVLARGIPGVIGGYVLTDLFRHLDLIVHAAVPGRPLAGDDQYHGHPAIVLYDPDHLLPEPPLPLARGAAFYPEDRITFFFYMLHAFAVSMQRAELALTRAGIVAVQDLLIAVMLAENGVRQRGGNKRLNPYLTDEQRRYLERLPATDSNPETTIAAVAYLTRDFIRRGRRLALLTGATWPSELEAAALAHLRQALGIDPDSWRPA